MKKEEILLVCSPVTRGFLIPLNNLHNILYKIYGNNLRTLIASEDLIIINGCKYQGFTVLNLTNIPFVNRILNELSIVKLICQNCKNSKLVILFTESDLLLSMMVCKLFKKKIIRILPSRITISHTRGIYDSFIIIMQEIGYIMSDKIIVYSNKLIDEWCLQNHTEKILIAREHSVDFTKFFIKKPINLRSKNIGFVGRFRQEKGIIDLIQAFINIADQIPDYNLIIVGDGEQKSLIVDIINKNKMENRIILSGWMSHDDLVNFYNEIQLLVVPSKTEGLPNVILESLACGTPVLSTSTGAIPDIIIHGKNGWLMNYGEGDSIEVCINKSILDNDPNMSEFARDFMLNQFNIHKTVEMWRNILKE